MKCLNQIDAQQVGSICIDSNSYLSISDMFKMNNRVSDICKILSGKRTFVGKLRNDDSKSIAVKFCETEDCIIGTASCCGEKAYHMLPNKDLLTKDFAWNYIELLSHLAHNIRCKIALSTAKDIHI